MTSLEKEMSGTSGGMDTLWNALHSNNYLNTANTSLNLPAQNQLGAPSVSGLLQQSSLFPSAALVMSLTSATNTNAIILTGTLNGSFLGNNNPPAVATFWLDAQQNTQLTIAVSLPKNYTLQTTFSALQDSYPGAQLFSNASLSAMSSNPVQTVAFSGVPALDTGISKLWGSNGAGAMTGVITLPASTGQSPVFTLQSALATASVTAGLAAMQVQLQFVASSTAAATASIQGAVSINQSWPPIAVSMPLPLSSYPLPAFLPNGTLAQPVTDLVQLAPLFMGQALANLVPARFPIGNTFTLVALTVSLTADCSALSSLLITVTSPINLTLLPANLANLQSIGISFFLLPGATPPIQVMFSGQFQLAGNSNLLFNAGFSLPDCVVNANNVKPIDVGALISSFIPGLNAPRNDLTITALSTTLSPLTSTYSFNGAVTVGSGAWSLDFGRGLTVLALEEITFNAVRSSQALALNFGASMIFLGSQFQLNAINPGGNQGWTFTGQMSPTTPMSLKQVASALLPFIPGGFVPNISITYLAGSFNTAVNTYQISASLQWKLDIVPIIIDASFLLQSQRSSASDTPTFSGYVKGEIDINNLLMDVAYIFSPTSSDIIFTFRQLTVDWHRDQTDPYVAISLNACSVGDLFAFLIAFADPGNDFKLPSPWDALEKIGLPNMTVKVHLLTKEIEVKIDISINLGFIDVTAIGLSYQRNYGQSNINIELFGTFLGQDYTSTPLGWDLLNDPAPAVPGAGTETFDLEYFGMGQHLSIRGTQPETMDDVIAALEGALTPVGNPQQNPSTQLPGLMFDAGSNWLIGTRFTVMSTVELSVIFNDPKLYGLLIQLSGGKAGVLAGLRFEILYRKISDSIGVYHIELTLPDAMRHLEFGEVSITLPIVIIDIYTNGNFMIDCGFPPSLTDFSQSFSVQVLPFIGYGGFYFGVLDGQTSNQVPTIDNGNFTTVLEFGFALQVGVGKTLSLGILSGGISITVGGMLQGVLSWYEPNQKNMPSVQFYKLVGTVAIVGEVSASVNFGIIQAGVSLIVYASATINLECYKAILLEVSAGVEVEVSIKILFIRIHFSFSATITESFTIGSDSATPWHVIQSSDSGNNQQALPGALGAGLRGNLRGSYRSRALLLRPTPHSQLRRRSARPLTATRPLRLFQSTANSPVQVNVTVIPLVSQALCSDFAFGGGPTPPQGTSTPVLATLLGLPTSSDPNSGINQMLTLLLDWAVASIGHEHDTVSSAVLAEILDALQDASAADAYFSYPALVNLFTSNNIVFNLIARPVSGDSSAPTDMAFMAMIPEISLSAPGYSINFSTDRVPLGDYENTVQQYFADLMAQFAQQQPSLKNANAAGDSLATFIFRNYFLMLARGAVQSAKNALASASWNVSDTVSSLTSVANNFNNDYTVHTGDSIGGIAAMFSLTAAVLEAANSDLDFSNLQTGQTVFVPSLQINYLSQSGDSGAGIASCFGIAFADLQAANPAVNFGALQPGTALSIPALRIAHTSIAGETAQDIATEFGISLTTLSTANPGVVLNPLAAGVSLLIPVRVLPLAVATANQGSASLLANNCVLALGDIPLVASASDSLSSIASRFAVTLPALLTANAESTGLLQAGQPVALGNLSSTTRTGDSLNGLAAYWGLSADAILASNATLALSTPQTLIIPLPGGNTSYAAKSGDTVSSVLATYSPQGVTLDQILQNNTVALSAGQPFVLNNIIHTTSTSYFLSYTATAGDTLGNIAIAYFPATQQIGAIAALMQWNNNTPPGQALTPGTVVKIPYYSTLANITRLYHIDIATLAASPTIATVSLLAPRAAIIAPSVSHVVQGGIDSLASIAQSYGISLEQLCDAVAVTSGLLAQGTVNVPAVPGMKLAALASLLGSGGGFTQAANMASRFMLNGLRLPAPQFAGQPAPGNNTYPLYALVGQEFPVTAPLASSYALTLSANAGWVQGNLNMPLTSDEIQRVQDFSTLTFQSGVQDSQVQPVPLYSYVPDRQPTRQIQPWHTADLPADLAPVNQKLGQPSLWPLPSTLQKAVAASPQGFLPYQGVYSEQQAGGKVATTVLQAARWATTIDIRIQQLPNATADSYLMLGADQIGAARLLAVWAWLAANSGTATIYLAYSSQANNDGGTIVTDLLDRTGSFLLKTNLSTETHGEPPVLLKNARTAKRLSSPTDAAPSASFNASDSTRLLELLWECSVVNSGGFYLRYVTSDGQTLPGTLFQSGRQATLKLIIVLDQQAVGNPAILAFNNAMLVGDNVDSGATDSGFAALVHTLAASDSLSSIAASYPTLNLDAPSLAGINQTILGLLPAGSVIAGQTVAPADTLATIAARAGLTVSTLGSSIATTPGLFTAGALLQLAGNPVQIVRAGDTLASIAEEYDFLDPAALAGLNASSTSLLALNASLLVPGQAAHTVVAGDSFASIAQSTGVDVSMLGEANADTAILAAGASITVAGNTLRMNATLPPGHLGFTVTRPNPQPANIGQETPQQALNTLYNLLGFQLDANNFFNASNEGLPAGPNNSDDTAPWNYRQTMAVFRLGASNDAINCSLLPPISGNPYAGLAANAAAAISLGFLDILGNRTQGSSLGQVQINTGYTDELVALSAWPGIHKSYRLFSPLSKGGANFALSITLAPDRYLASGSVAASTAAQNATQDLATYQGISYQLQQQDVDACLSTSLGAVGNPQQAGLRARMALLGASNAAYVFLGQSAGLQAIAATTGSSGYTTLANLVNPAASPAGYPLAYADLALANASARADLLFRQGTVINIPVNALSKATDTAQDIATTNNISVAQLADNNASIALAAGVTVATATRSWSLPATPALCLQAISQMESVPLLDAAGGAQGLVTANAKTTLAANITLVYEGKSVSTGNSDTLTTIAANFQQQLGSTVSIADVAMANRYLDGIFAPATALTLSSYLTTSSDNLSTLAANYGPPPGQTGTAVEQFLLGNATVVGLWPVGTALYIKAGSHPVAEGETLAGIAQAAATTPTVLLTANSSISLANYSLIIPGLADSKVIATSIYQADGSETFAGIVSAYAGWSIDALATLNQYLPALFAATPITLGGITITPTLNDSFNSLAAAFKLSVTAFAEQIATLPNLLWSGAIIAAPAMQVTTSDTLGGCAARYKLSAGSLAAANACLPGLLPSGQTLSLPNDPASYSTLANDSFSLFTARINTARNANKLPPVAVSDVGNAASSFTLTARTLLSPPRGAVVQAVVTPAYASAITPLTVSLQISRDPARVAPAFRNAPRVISVATTIPAAPLADDGSQSLNQFATDFESAFPGLKLATGPQQIQSSTQLAKPSMLTALGGGSGTSGKGRGLWVVNFSGQGQAIGYAVDGSTPRYFGLPPLATSTWTGSNISVPTYDSNNGLQWPSPAKTQNFQGIDPDQWQQTFLAAIDQVLQPDYAVPGMTDSAVNANIATLLGVKSTLASSIAQTLVPIVGTDTSGLSDATTSFTQQLLIALATAYEMQTLVQFPVTVSGSGAGSNPDTAPRLSGQLIANIVTTWPDTDPNHKTDPAHPLALLAAQCGVGSIYLATTISDFPLIIRPGVTTSFGGQPYVTTAADTLQSIAAVFKTDVATLAASITIGSNDIALFLGSTAINVTPAVAPAALLTVSVIADWLVTTVADVLLANAERSDFFAPGSTVTAGTVSVTPASGQTLASVANSFGNLEAMAAALAEVDSGALKGGYTLNTAAPPRALQRVPQLAFSTSKAALAQGGSTLTSLLSLKDPAAQRSVLLNLDYRVNQLEFDIHTVAGIAGYQSSSWLTFVIPIEQGSNTASDIGQAQLPVPLNAYPAPVTVTNQNASAGWSGDAEATATQWTYGLSSVRQMAAQDQVTLELRFNTAIPAPNSRPASASGSREAIIEALAAFMTVWPAISADLAQMPDVQPNAAPPAVKNAMAALAALATAVQTAWQQQTRQLALADAEADFTYVLSALAAGDSTPIINTLLLERLPVAGDTGPDDFIFPADASFASGLDQGNIPAPLTTLFANYGFPLSTSTQLQSNTPGSDWTIVDSAAMQTPVAGNPGFTAPQTYRLLLQTSAGAPALAVYRQILWPAVRLSGSEQWLDTVQAGERLVITLPTPQPLAQPLALDIDFYRLSLLLRQNGWGGSSVTRNANLIQGASINSAFVYETPLTAFPTKITPFFRQTSWLNLPGNSLTAALAAFFAELMSAQAVAQPGSSRNIRISANYWQAIDGVSDPTTTPLTFQVPLVLLPLYAFNVDTDSSPAPGQFCANLANAISLAADNAGLPPVAPGKYLIDVVIYNMLDGNITSPQPLLELSGLCYPRG